MDRSEIYIKMCEEAEDILEKWIPTKWDYCYCKIENKIVVLSGYETDGGYYGHSIYENEIDGCKKNKHFLIPRQDQLQNMMGNYYDAVERMYEALCNEHWDLWQDYKSMEQLWLGFVMFENYNKKWSEDKQKWIKKG